LLVVSPIIVYAITDQKLCLSQNLIVEINQFLSEYYAVQMIRRKTISKRITASL